MKASKPINKLFKLTTLSALMSASLLTALPYYANATNSGSPITVAELNQDGFPYPTDIAVGASHTELANYAWRLFIASNQQTLAHFEQRRRSSTTGSQQELY